MKKILLVFALLGGFLVSCGGEDETSSDSSDDSTDTEEVMDTEEEEMVEEDVVEETADQDLATLIIGDWEYVESTIYMGEESMSMKSAHAWTMTYTEDGNFIESQQLVEGGETYDAEGSFSIDGTTLKREGLLEVELSSIDENEMIIENMGTEMKFVRK